MLVGSEPPQGLEALSEVVGVEEGFEVLSELLVGLVVIAPNGGFLEGAVHPRLKRRTRDPDVLMLCEYVHGTDVHGTIPGFRRPGDGTPRAGRGGKEEKMAT